jgi:hypothetical protein
MALSTKATFTMATELTSTPVGLFIHTRTPFANGRCFLNYTRMVDSRKFVAKPFIVGNRSIKLTTKLQREIAATKGKVNLEKDKLHSLLISHKSKLSSTPSTTPWQHSHSKKTILAVIPSRSPTRIKKRTSLPNYVAPARERAVVSGKPTHPLADFYHHN